METDCMSHPCAIQPCPLTRRFVQLNAAWSQWHNSPHVSMLWLPYCCRTICLVCIQSWTRQSWSFSSSFAGVSTLASGRKNLSARLWVWDGWGKFSYSCARYLFHFFPFPLAKLQENICHGFKRFISFKAEGAGLPTHQWDHAILPAETRMGWSMWTKFPG